jgi:crossover junction endodeoxyribonuclease RusA
VLPEPPSANAYWRRHGNIIHVSTEAKAYKDAVGMLTAKYRTKNQCAFPSGDLSLVVIWHRSARRGDLDNRLKVLFDALRGTVFRDDKQIAHIDAERCDSHASVPKGFMKVAIRPRALEAHGGAL